MYLSEGIFGEKHTRMLGLLLLSWFRLGGAWRPPRARVAMSLYAAPSGEIERRRNFAIISHPDAGTKRYSASLRLSRTNARTLSLSLSLVSTPVPF